MNVKSVPRVRIPLSPPFSFYIPHFQSLSSFFKKRIQRSRICGVAIWSFDKEVGWTLADYGRHFIALLDPDVQEKFAYKNAKKLIKKTRKR